MLFLNMVCLTAVLADRGRALSAPSVLHQCLSLFLFVFYGKNNPKSMRRTAFVSKEGAGVVVCAQGCTGHGGAGGRGGIVKYY
jgi:hypothetical protein